MSCIWQNNSNWNQSGLFVNALGLKLKKSFPWIALSGNHCVNLDGCPTSQLGHLSGPSLWTGRIGDDSEWRAHMKHWEWTILQTKTTFCSSPLWDGRQEKYRRFWDQIFLSSARCAWHILSPSCWCCWVVQHVWAANFHASYWLDLTWQTSLISSLPTFLGAPCEVPSQGYFSIISFFHIVIFLEKVERLQSASHTSWFLVVCSHSSMHNQSWIVNVRVV